MCWTKRVRELTADGSAGVQRSVEAAVFVTVGSRSLNLQKVELERTIARKGWHQYEIILSQLQTTHLSSLRPRSRRRSTAIGKIAIIEPTVVDIDPSSEALQLIDGTAVHWRREESRHWMLAGVDRFQDFRQLCEVRLSNGYEN